MQKVVFLLQLNSIYINQKTIMKKRIYYSIALILIINSFLLLTNVFWQWLQLGNNNTILTTDVNESINTNNWNWTISDPMREWAYQLVKSSSGSYQLSWIINDEITDHDTAMNNTLNIIFSIINYALWLVSIVALVYLLIHWFMMVTAAWDDSKYKKGLKGIKYATIALLWLWLSWFIISFIFWIIENIAT